MVDLATLSLAIDSRPAVTAAGDLDKLASSAAGAEKAAAAMSAGATQSTVNMQRVVATTSQAVGGINALSQAANNNARAVGLSANELRNLSYQINDVATMALTGASAFQIMATQGGQLVQIAQASGGGLRGLFAQASSAAEAAAGRIGLVGGALGGIAVALATATVAAAQYNAQQKELERTTFGAGRASGATLQTLNDAALSGASRGTISTSASRDVIASLNTSGRIDPKVYGDVSTNMRDLAKLMGTDIPTATDTVTSALSGGVAGFDRLNAVLGLGGSAMREQIKDLNESGQAFEAQRIIVDAYAKRIQELNANKGFFERLNEQFDFNRNTSNELSAIGSLFGGSSTPEQQLASARRRHSGIQYQRDSGLGFDPQELAAANAEVTKLEATISSAAAKGKDAKTALTSLTVQPLIESLNPAQKQLTDIQNGAQLIAKYLAEGGIDKDGLARRTMDGLKDQARTLADELTRGGSSLAASLRDAQFNLQVVGSTGFGRSTATAEERAGNDVRSIEARNLEPGKRDEAILAITDRLEAEITAARRDTSLSETGMGGAYSRLSQQVQQQVLDAAQQYSRIPAAIIAAVAEKESNGNLDIGFTKQRNPDGSVGSAYGLGQITSGTARAAIQGGYLPPDFDRTNRDTMADGIAAILTMKLDAAGGDRTKAIANYYGSDSPTANNAYAADILRRAGEMGDASTQGQVRDQDERNRALADEQKRVVISTQLLGVNGEAYDAAGRKAQFLADQQAKGIPITADVIAQAERYSTGMAAAARALATTQAGRDLTFQRDQLGRDATDQRAFADARSRFGDVTTPQATAYIAQSRDIADLTAAKTATTSALTGFASDLAHGATAAQAATNAFSRLADTVLNKVIDSLVSSAFGSALKSGGGIGSLFGFDSGGYTGSGGRYEPAGIVHRGEVVWSQSDVARYGGPHVVEAMRHGYPGYADGGRAGYPSMPSMPSAANMNLSVVVNERAGGDMAQTRTERGPDGNPRVIVDMLSRQQAADIASRRGPLGAAVAGGTRLRG